MTDRAPPPLDRGHAAFLDFDGVLVELAARPDAVVVHPEVIAAVEAAVDRLDGALAIVTGRMLEDIDRQLGLSHIAAAATHGAEHRAAGGALVPIEEPILSAARELAARVRDFAEADPRLVLEAKPAGVALHYRAAPERGEAVRAALAEALKGFDDWRLLEGHMLLEARRRGADKGVAVTRFMQEPPFAGKVPVFVGDDVTDEDGIRVVQSMGGFGIRVGGGESAARYHLPDPPAVLRYLTADS